MTDTARILVIDDEPQVISVMKRSLSRLGYETLSATGGAEGLKMFRDRRPDLVLVDIRMPDMDGLEVLAGIKKASPDTPVIIISGRGTREDVIRALQHGASDYISKPVDETEILQHAIGKALERIRLLEANRSYQESLKKQVIKDSADLWQRGNELQEAYRSLNREVEKRRAAEKAIEREKALMQTMIDGIKDPAMVVDPEHRVLMINQTALSLLPGHLTGAQELTCHLVYRQSESPCSGSERECVLERLREEKGKTAISTHKEVLENGEERLFELEALPLWNEDGSLHGFLEVIHNKSGDLDIETQLREHQAKLYQLAHYDSLTNLPNRMLCQDRVQQMLLKAQRNGNKVAMLLLDLDRFKKINETLGHEVGDNLLCEVGGRLEGCVRRSDTVARLGGDEFAVILDDIKDLKNVAVIARKILGVLTRPIMISGYELYVTTSIGISLYPDDGDGVEGLLRCAETAMYRAKESGKNNYQYFTADMNTRAFEYLLLESGLRKAIDNRELVVHYQPQFDLRDNRLVGMEALLRWRHPEKGMVSPDDFIPLAEETGLIESIGEWVLREACVRNKAWQEAGYPPVRMAVNISARQFRRQNIVELINGILSGTGLDARYLELELTESIVMHEAQATGRTLQQLHDMGIKFAIDDFGTGYSSLSYLKLFPIDFLKIDKSFVFNITTDANDAAIADSIIALAHSMNLKVIAEGVETEEQYSLLRQRGCDYVQGYFFSGPLSADEFVEVFSQN